MYTKSLKKRQSYSRKQSGTILIADDVGQGRVSRSRSHERNYK